MPTRQPHDMPPLVPTGEPTLSNAEAVLREACRDLEGRLRGGENVRAEAYLARQPSLSHDPEQAMDLIHLEYITRRELGDVPAREEYFERFPHWRARLEQQFQLDELLDEPTLAAAQQDGGPSAPQKPVAAQTYDGRFRILRLLARGGMGRVMCALDTELNREVAVKELQPSLAGDDQVRERFLREAEITGQLEHPGIVPIYGLGRDAAGSPFYAMRLVRGQSLQQAVEAFHGAAHDRRYHCLEFQKLLRRFLHVCETIAYAHSRDVIHRDIKPANILLGPFGETLVVDWGVARAIGPADSKSDGPEGTSTVESGQPPQLPQERRPADLSDRWSSRLTRVTGEVLGTPAFMSPEQASSEEHGVGPATDVYSLGATLFMLLTGRPPFAGTDVDATLRGVIAGDFRQPRNWDRAIPPPLEAVCLKAMARKAEDRYASPRDLADDVEHWLADEPVSAARDAIATRLARWGRRHRPRVVAAAIALLVVAVVSVAAAVRINGERLRADRERVEANRRNARLAFDRGFSQTAAREYGAGILWFARALQHAPADDAAMRQVILTNMDAARHHLLRRARAFTHGVPLRAMVFSPDGSRLVTTDNAGIVRLWDVRSGSRLAEQEVQIDRTYAVGFSDEGTAVIAAADDSTLVVRSLWPAGADVPAIAIPAAEKVTWAAFSPDGGMLGVGSNVMRSSKARFWRLSDGQLLAELDHPWRVQQIVLRPQNGEVATVAADGRVRIFDLATARSICELKPESGTVRKIAFSPDGTKMLMGDSEGTVSCWDTATQRRMFDLARDTGEVTALACAADGQTVAAAWDTGAAQAWNLADRRPSCEHLRIDRYTTNLAFRPGNRELLIPVEPHSAVLWDLPEPSGMGLALDQPEITFTAVSPDGKLAVTGTTAGTARLRHTDTGTAFGEPLSHNGPVRRIAFRPDSAVVATAGSGGEARLWSAADGRPHGKLMNHRRRAGDGTLVQDVAFSPDGRWLVTGDNQGIVRLWDGDRGDRLHEFGDIKAAARTVCFAAGGTRVVAGYGSPDCGVRAWDRTSGELLWTLRHGGPVRTVCASPDGRLVMSASNDKTARFWDVDGGLPIGRELLHRGEVFVAAFSPDGRLAVTGGYDATVRLWEVPSGRPYGEPMRHDGVVMSAEFSADGKRLLTGSADRTARLWDVATCLPLSPPFEQSIAVQSASLHPSGQIAFASRRWQLPNPLPDAPRLVSLWTQLATQRTFSAGDNIEWLNAAALAAASSDFQALAGRSWSEWAD